MTRLSTTAAAAALAFALTGCAAGGGSGDDAGSNGPEKAVTTFADAIQAGDYTTLCDTIDPKTVTQLEKATPDKDCPEIFKENEDSFRSEVPEDATLDIQGSTIAEDQKTATVTVKGKDGKEQEISLVNVDNEWKISLGQ